MNILVKIKVLCCFIFYARFAVSSNNDWLRIRHLYISRDMHMSVFNEAKEIKKFTKEKN